MLCKLAFYLTLYILGFKKGGGRSIAPFVPPGYAPDYTIAMQHCNIIITLSWSDLELSWHDSNYGTTLSVHKYIFKIYL